MQVDIADNVLCEIDDIPGVSASFPAFHFHVLDRVTADENDLKPIQVIDEI